MISPVDNLVNGGGRAAARVRGLRADRDAPVRLCRHCDTPVAADARDPDFCCAGCAYVFRLVHEHGLEGYYRIRDATVPPVGAAVFEPRDFAWLEKLARDAEQGAGVPELALGVQGISCAGCVWLIEKLFHEQPGALAIETDVPSGRLRLRWARGVFDVTGFARTLHAFNYLVGPPGAEPEEAESRRLLRRVGLCAAFTMNLMLFSLPRYFGMESSFPYARLFDTLAFALGTLSLLVGGLHFLGRAVRALRHGALHLDLPIALGIVGAYAGSVAGWALDRPEFTYFDFVGAFITLMLLGRWAQVSAVERNRQRLLQGQAGPQPVVREDAAGGRVTVPAEEVRAGDRLVLRAGQTVPVAARLESPAASFGTAWINGEAEPHDYRAGGLVPAGALLLSRDETRLRAQENWSESLLAQLLRPANRGAVRHRALELIVGGYLAAILVMSVAAAAGWWLYTHDPLRTAAVTIAVLVVSCPCAVGLAFPLADELAAVALRRAGVFVREADLWPRLARIRRIVFDKTGTLTLENPRLGNPEAIDGLSPEARAALFALVGDSLHPVGRSLLEALLGRVDAGGLQPAAGYMSEEAGWGVRLETAAEVWTLGKPGWADHRALRGGGTPPSDGENAGGTELACDGVVLARFRFADELRADAREEIAAFRRGGREVFILSGDHPAKVAAMADALGLPPGQALGGASPQAKADWIRAHDRGDTLMLGDGANDTLAFDAAFARGTPVVHRGLLEGRADFYYLGRGLDGLRRLFEVNTARRRTHCWLLAFSVAYNAVAVGLALTGHVNPLVAAILMPISSLASLAIVGAGLGGAGRPT